MSRPCRKILASALLALLCTAAQGRDWLAGLFQSPRGIGLTVVLDGAGRELDIFTLRNDFYGILSGRTAQSGACLTYTHDYVFLVREDPDRRLMLHAGAGAAFGYVHDYEKGFFSAYDRALVRRPGWMTALAGNAGLRADFRRRITLDLSFSVLPGIHLRTDPDTGTLIASLYRNGLGQAFFPQVNLLYRF